jgi:hypothetical protein
MSLTIEKVDPTKLNSLRAATSSSIYDEAVQAAAKLKRGESVTVAPPKGSDFDDVQAFRNSISLTVRRRMPMTDPKFPTPELRFISLSNGKVEIHRQSDSELAKRAANLAARKPAKKAKPAKPARTERSVRKDRIAKAEKRLAAKKAKAAAEKTGA